MRTGQNYNNKHTHIYMTQYLIYYHTNRFSSQSFGSSEVDGYLQQDNSNVTSMQPYQT